VTTPKPSQETLTADAIMALNPCEEYPRDRVRELLGGDAIEWSALVPVLLTIHREDARWLVTHLLWATSPQALVLWAADCAERPLATLADERTRKVCAATLATTRAWCRGEATDGEVRAARAAAWAAEAAAARAARAAARAAEAAAARAARAAARAAEAAAAAAVETAAVETAARAEAAARAAEVAAAAAAETAARAEVAARAEYRWQLDRAVEYLTGSLPSEAK
jgi:hypothetical protein